MRPPVRPNAADAGVRRRTGGVDKSDVALYEGTVRHARVVPTEHRFDHRVYLTLLDVDALPGSLDGYPGWSARRAAPSRFRRSDYLDGTERPLGDAVRDLVEQRLGRRPGGQVLMLTNLRTWGWTFNPITVYWCLDAGGAADAVVLEVTNTPWGERTFYVLDALAGPEHVVAKTMHVSPFLDSELTYRIRAEVPERSLLVRIEVLRDGQLVLDTSLAARRTPFTRRRALGVLVRQPLMTWRVSAAIHLQALHLWRKHVPVQPHTNRSSQRGAPT